MTESIEARAAKWAAGRDTGVSSKTIMAFMLNGAAPDPGYPHDASDLKRCLALLEAVPEWEPRLGELSALPGVNGQCWKALAEKWEMLKVRAAGAAGISEDKRYEFVTSTMREILHPIEDASGQVVRLGKNASITFSKAMTKEEGQAVVNAAQESEQLFDQAARLVIREQKASTSFIQRHLQIGYNRAARIIEDMETAGIVGKPNHVGKREVLVQDVEHYEKSMKVAGRVQELAAASGIPADTIMDAAKAAAGVEEGSNTADVGGVSGQRLKAFMERIERLEEEKSGLADDIKDVYAEAKGVGFDTKTIRKIIRLRKMDKEKRREEDELLELYKAAVGID